MLDQKIFLNVWKKIRKIANSHYRLEMGLPAYVRLEYISPLNCTDEQCGKADTEYG